MLLPLCWIIGGHRTHPPITGLLPSTGIEPTTFRNLENRHLFRTPVEHRSHDISHSKWNFSQMQITAKKWLTILAKSSTIVISEVSKYVPEKTYSKNCKRKQNLWKLWKHCIFMNDIQQMSAEQLVLIWKINFLI